MALSSICMSEELIWTSVNIPELEFIESGVQHLGVWFHGDFGWLNSGKQIWITNNAGRNWRLSLKPPENRLFYDSYFINSLEGWAVAGIFPSFLFHTKDGGISWESVGSQTFGNSSLTYIYFKDSLNGLGTFVVDKAIGWDFDVIGRTENGGKDWGFLLNVKGKGSFGKLMGINDKIWVEYSSNNEALYTEDFGNSFQWLPPNPSFPDIFSRHFLQSKYGWATYTTYLSNQQRRSDIIVTIDGGFTWSQSILSLQGISTTNVNRYIDICLLKEGNGAVLWYSGNNYFLYFTSNGGDSWSKYTVLVMSEYQLECNRENREFWLVPSPNGGDAKEQTLFYTSIPDLAAINQSKILPILWGDIKRGKEF